MEALSKKINRLSIMKQPTQMMQCDLYGGGHENQECQAIKSLTMPNEHVNYIGNAPQPQNNLYSDTYNPRWRNHPNFFWRNQG